mgnify:CR=1 FL=1
MAFIENDSFDLIWTRLPYADIIKYSNGINEDLLQLKVRDFLEKREVFWSSYGQYPEKGYMIPMSFDIMKNFQDVGFKLKEFFIKEQHNC